MPFGDRVKYMEQGTGQVFYLWRDEDETDWVVGMFTGGRMRRQRPKRARLGFDGTSALAVRTGAVSRRADPCDRRRAQVLRSRQLGVCDVDALDVAVEGEGRFVVVVQ